MRGENRVDVLAQAAGREHEGRAAIAARRHEPGEAASQASGARGEGADLRLGREDAGVDHLDDPSRVELAAAETRRLLFPVWLAAEVLADLVADVEERRRPVEVADHRDGSGRWVLPAGSFGFGRSPSRPGIGRHRASITGARGSSQEMQTDRVSTRRRGGALDSVHAARTEQATPWAGSQRGAAMIDAKGSSAPVGPRSAAELFAEAARRASAREPFALCTVLATQWSAPRDAGAKMLVASDGSVAGTIGGGPLEASVIFEAVQLLRGGGGDSGIRRFALTTAGDAAEPLPAVPAPGEDLGMK